MDDIYGPIVPQNFLIVGRQTEVGDSEEVT